MANKSNTFLVGYLSITELELILFLYQESKTPKQIAEHFGVDLTTAYVYANRLSKKGYCQSKRIRTWQSSSEYSLTKSAEEIVKSIKGFIV